MPRAIPKDLRLLFSTAYRDAIQHQMNVINENKDNFVDREAPKRLIGRELRRLRAEFNKTQAEITTIKGRMLHDDSMATCTKSSCKCCL